MHHKHGSGYFGLLHFATQTRAYGSLSGERKTNAVSFSERTDSVDGRSSRVEKKRVPKISGFVTLYP